MSDGSPILRVTIRCLVQDLGLSASDARRNVTELDHEVCKAFVSKRSQSTIGIEKLQPITTAAEVYTLHAGRWRGATWHDEASNSVWLLFELQDRTFARALLEVVPPLITLARQEPGQEIVGIVAGRVRTGVLVERADDVEAIWVAISMKLFAGETDLPSEWLPLLLAAFFPEVSSPLELQIAEGMPNRKSSDDEQVFVHYSGARSSGL